MSTYFGYNSRKQEILDAILAAQGSSGATDQEIVSDLVQILTYFTNDWDNDN